MSDSDKTIPKVFILESLDFEDESNRHFEGEIIAGILNFSNIECEYNYFRTKKEFDYLLKKFEESKFRYLHISCHGSKNSLSFSLDNVSFDELCLVLAPVLDKKRLFISACSATNEILANKIFSETYCYSLIGPSKKPNINDAAIFWASFYHIMFNKNVSSMKKEDLTPVLSTLAQLYKIPMKYYSSSRNSTWKEIGLK